MEKARFMSTLEVNRQRPLPWYINVSPAFYDDPHDTGFGWEGWASNEHEAIPQALEACHRTNDREDYQHEEDVDPDAAQVHVAEIDFRRFAGPLLYWARSTGNAEGPLWKAMALSGTVHWLFDRHLISLTDDYRLLVSHNKVPGELRSLFEKQMDRIHLPKDTRLWPRPNYLRRHREAFMAA